MRVMVAQKEIPSSNESDDDKRRSVPGLALWFMLVFNLPSHGVNNMQSRHGTRSGPIVV